SPPSRGLTMNRRLVAALTVAAFAAGTWVLADPPQEKPKAKPADKKKADKDVFGLTKVWDFHLEIAAKEFEKMQPAGGMRFPGMPGGPGGPPGSPPTPGGAADPNKDTHRGGGFGMEFPWAHSDLTAEGKSLKNLGVRYKGNASYMA